MPIMDSNLPRDASGAPIQLFPPATAVATTVDATISSATDITLQATTTAIEVTALSKGIYLKWASTAASSDFDEFIAPDTTRQYVIPTGVTVVSVIEQTASATLILIEKAV